MKRIFLSLLVLAIILPAAADEIQTADSWGVDSAYYFDDNKGYGSDGVLVTPSYTPVEVPSDFTFADDDPGRSLGNGWGGLELQVWGSRRWTIPMLQNDNALMSGNNLMLEVKPAISPVTMTIDSRAVLTPIAFFTFEGGVHAGTGWYFSPLGFNGLGLNENGTGTADHANFSQAVFKTWGSGTFQFDLAAVMPGEWNHVVVQVNEKITGQMYTDAKAGEAWQYLADSGQNFNGAFWTGTYTVGYQMPLAMNFVGIMTETVRNVGSVAALSRVDDGGWGSDFMKVTTGPLANFALNEHNSLLCIFQLKNDLYYTEDTVFNNYFKNWSATGESYFKFHRVAFLYSMSL